MTNITEQPSLSPQRLPPVEVLRPRLPGGELTEADLIWRQPCTVLSYLVDGAMLQMPLAKRPPKQGYATPHWAPACFRPIEHIAPKERQRYGRSA